MTPTRRILCFAFLALAQTMLGIYCGFTPYLALPLLPLAIMTLPYGFSPAMSCAAAFAAGFVVDFFTTGALGLSSAALLPVALLRRPIAEMAAGELVSFSPSTNPLARLGLRKSAVALTLSTALYVVIYTVLEAAGQRTIGFHIWRIFLSTAAGTALQMLICRILYRDDD